MKALSPNGVYRFTVSERDGKFALEIYNREHGSIERNWLPEGESYWIFETADDARKFAGAYLASNPGSTNDPRSYSGDLPELDWEV